MVAMPCRSTVASDSDSQSPNGPLLVASRCVARAWEAWEVFASGSSSFIKRRTWRACYGLCFVGHALRWEDGMKEERSHGSQAVRSDTAAPGQQYEPQSHKQEHPGQLEGNSEQTSKFVSCNVSVPDCQWRMLRGAELPCRPPGWDPGRSLENEGPVNAIAEASGLAAAHDSEGRKRPLGPAWQGEVASSDRPGRARDGPIPISSGGP